MRKGLTLVEILVVITIAASLGGMMSLSISRSNVKATAKATTIVNNVNACKIAAALYCFSHFNEDINAAAGDMLAENVPNWKDFTNEDKIKYTAEGSTPEDWTLTVDFSGDTDKAAIITALEKVKGYGKNGTENTIVNTGKFKVESLSGKMTSENASGSNQNNNNG